MKEQWNAIVAEFAKNRHSKITWVTFVAFSLAPLFGSVFMIMMKDNGYDDLSGALKTKAVLFSVEANWNSFLSILSQAVGVGGVLIFGFVASWLFGREYSDGTAKDLLALPVSRTKIINAKFVYYFAWCIALVVANLILGLLLGVLLNLPGWSGMQFVSHLKVYFLITLMIVLLNTIVAFFAIAGRGYLAPLGIVALLLVLAQIIGALGFGQYFPWAVPGLFSGSGGEEMKNQLDFFSFAILVLTGVIGYFATIFWWRFADQAK